MRSGNAAIKRKAFGYCRCSTEAQSERGDTLEAQKRAIQLVCELEGFELVEIYSDPAISGSVPFASRPGGAQLLSVADAENIIVSTKLDRVFRDAHDASGTLKILKKRNVGLYLRDLGGDVTMSNVSSLVFGLLSNVAEFERSRIAERIRDVKKSQRSSGRYMGGGVPLGFALETDPSTGKLMLMVDAELQAEARKLKEQGYSARLAAGSLKAQGYAASHKSVLRLWQQLVEPLPPTAACAGSGVRQSST
ncbi:recombinase family protein [Hyphomicrobium facile]|uniref:Site-specific DNA recombinase n=1 Tax=Hyphomicrobium facile TaxID=51670 RepID=A0A1I7NE52_9HYPH|nr:recombinase family protein [Hyphomicrobium facile]SFV32929.1 Site-specific DNA recombinase [Hyphomicrobium facile]